MDISVLPQEAAFEQEFSAWLEANLPPEWRERATRSLDEHEQNLISIAWNRKLGEAGYLGIAWPKAYGGRDASFMERALHSRQLRLHDAPPLANTIGLNMVGPIIMQLGTEEQRQEHLSKIISGDANWVQGFSEPNAGSDLAGLQTRADLDGDEWVVNGTKIWGNGQYADWCACLCRTDQNVPKHRGISLLIFDMKSPGVSVHPLKDMGNKGHFTQMFFDNVRVPRANVLGNVNEGWRVATQLLSHERGLITMSFLDDWEVHFDELKTYAKATSRNGQLLADVPRIREKFGEVATEMRLMRLTNLRYITWYERGEIPREESSYLKLFWVKLEQSLSDLATLLAGPEILREPPDARAIDEGSWLARHIRSRAGSIYGGTQDIQRNIIAERILGLPR